MLYSGSVKPVCTFSSLLKDSPCEISLIAKRAKLIIRPRKWQSSQPMIHCLKILLSLVLSEEILWGSASSVSTHEYFELMHLIYSICFKPKSERESLTKLSSLKHGDISFSPLHYLDCLELKCFQQLLCPIFQICHFLANLLKQNTYVVRKQNKHAL